MKNQTLIIVVVVLLILGAGAYLMMSKNSTPAPASSGTSEQGSVMQESPTAAVMQTQTESSGAAMENTAAKEFTVTGKSFSFSPSEITVKKGDTVKITFKNTEGFHDWVLDEFNATTKKIQAGSEDTVTFTADKTGTFEYYCSVGSHRAQGMVGKLTVE